MSPSWTKTGSNFILLAPAWWWGVKFVWEGTHLKRKKARIRQSVNEVIGAMGNGGAVRGLLWVIIYFALFTTPPPSALYPPLPTLSRGSWRWCNRARNRCHNSPPAPPSASDPPTAPVLSFKVRYTARSGYIVDNLSYLHINLDGVRIQQGKVKIISELASERCASNYASNANLRKAAQFWKYQPQQLTSMMSRIDPTLTANNSGSKPSNLKKYHIFGIVRTSAFTWSCPWWVIPYQSFE